MRGAPVEVAGRLALSIERVPGEMHDLRETFELRAATPEPEIMPEFENLANRWPTTP